MFREVKWLAHAHMAIKDKSRSLIPVCLGAIPAVPVPFLLKFWQVFIETSLTKLFHSKENANVIIVVVAGYLVATHYT